MDSFFEELLSTNIGQRKDAVNKIIKSTDNKRLIGKLKGVLEGGPTYAKLDALSAYGRIIEKDNKDDIDYLLTFLKNKDWHMRIEAIRCICDLLQGEAIDIITPFLNDKAYGVRSEVESLIQKINSISILK